MLKNKCEQLKDSKVSDKYKMVRFFEKRKLFRKLKCALKTENGDEVQEIRNKINYIVVSKEKELKDIVEFDQVTFYVNP